MEVRHAEGRRLTVLVAGGAGYLGSVLVRELLQRGHRVRVCDRLFYGGAGLTDLRDVSVETTDIRYLTGDDLAGVSAVINLAGISCDPIAEFQPELTMDMNVTGAVHLAELCKSAGIPRYVFASSCSVYDQGAADDDAPTFSEESATSPTSSYARSKTAAEIELLAMASEGFSPVILRKGTLFGWSPRMRFDLVVNTLFKDALRMGCMRLNAGGETWRPLVEVGDAARAYATVIEADRAEIHAETFNIVQTNYRVCEMALRVREALRRCSIDADLAADYSQPRTRSYRVNGRKFVDRFRFEFHGSIETSVGGLVARFGDATPAQLDDARYYNIRSLELSEAHT